MLVSLQPGFSQLRGLLDDGRLVWSWANAAFGNGDKLAYEYLDAMTS